MIDLDVLVVGGGAIGSVTAALMTGQVRGVMVLDADKEHVARMRDPGLELDRLGEQIQVRIDAYADPADLPVKPEFALVTLKAAYLEAALTPLRDRVDTFVSLGNGLVQDRVASLVGRDQLLIGTVEWGATNLGPGRLAQTTNAPFVIGEPDGSNSERLQQLGEALGTVAEVRISNNIRGQVWSKLLLMIGRLRATKASMLQDVERGVPCEVDVINGAVADRGAEHGVPTPLNAGIVELVHSYEQGQGRPGPSAFDELAERSQ